MLVGPITAIWHPFTTLKTSRPKPQTSPGPKLCLSGSCMLPAERSHGGAFIYSRTISSAFYVLSPIHTHSNLPITLCGRNTHLSHLIDKETEAGGSEVILSPRPVFKASTWHYF